MTEQADDVTRMDCPTSCPYRDRDHWHIEYPDGYGEIIAHDGSLIEPWDLGRPAKMIYPARQLRSRPGVRYYNQTTKRWDTSR